MSTLGGPPATPAEPAQRRPPGPAAAKHELGRAAADVDHEVRARRTRGGPQLRGGASEGQRRLLVPADNLRLDAKDRAHAAGEFGGVGRVAGRTRRHHAHRAAPGRDGLGVPPQRLERPLQRRGREPPGAVHPLAEPHDLHLPDDVGQFARAGSMSATSRRREFVPQSSAATRSLRSRRARRSRGVRPRHARAVRPPRPGSIGKRLAAERVYPAARRVRARPARAGT